MAGELQGAIITSVVLVLISSAGWYARRRASRPRLIVTLERRQWNVFHLLITNNGNGPVGIYGVTLRKDPKDPFARALGFSADYRQMAELPFADPLKHGHFGERRSLEKDGVIEIPFLIDKRVTDRKFPIVAEVLVITRNGIKARNSAPVLYEREADECF